MSSRRRQAASGSTSAEAAHAPPACNTVTPRLNPMVAAFRREVVSMLNTPPPLPRHLAHLSKGKVEVLAAFERISFHGEQQQSAQLCRVGGDDGEMWVTRTEGKRYYFPNAGRVNKRAREALNDEEDVAPTDEEGPRDMDVEGEEQETPTARRARARAHRRNPRTVEQDDPPSEGWFPQHNNADETPAHASTSRARNSAAPNAPKKTRRAPRSSQRDLDDDSSFQHDDEEGNETEREGSSRRAAAVKKSKMGKSKASTSANANAEASGSGSGSGARRSARRAARDLPAVTREEEDVFTAKREQTVDDLDSLCGGIGGFALGELGFSSPWLLHST